MSESIKDGGPAFPQNLAFTPCGHGHIASEYFPECEGMSLRDYFAAKAMQGFLSCSIPTKQWEITADEMGCLTEDVVSILSYQQADKMLAARERKEESK